ncbi:unnamed protein product [Ostreobium quekettii]|uniref:Peptidyl-prolyl cis-trans isomerase n=1 Tax=Ostreobium quekettii TaxID=121088 RepID=A0A8S1JBF6_9CHLO|nr:unnamed protein product [Ostreobium quekettii]CAD7704440.1 unnamed protein product [Ostreobium quekettii]
MAVLLETSKGDIVVDLYVEECPRTCLNFLKLCKIKYYNNCLFHNIQHNFIAQTGDPDGTGRGGSSIFGVMYGEQARFFEDEIRPQLKHKRKGTVAMANAGKNTNASQFYISTGKDLDSLDETHTVFGEVTEGWETLDAINDAYCDNDGRPYQNIRIHHTIVLEDPLDDPPLLADHIPDKSPEAVADGGDRLEDDWQPAEDTRPAEEIEEEVRRREAHHHAVVLEMIGDLPEADVKPPSDMLFVCKLNPVTTEEDLEIIFSRFGKVTSCDIIRDWKTGDSLCYAFIGLESDEACEEAYFKMNNVLIDDRRIKVDFSQSVYHIWRHFRRFGRKGDKALLEAQEKGQVPRKGPAPRQDASSGVEMRRGNRPDDYRMVLDEKAILNSTLEDSIRSDSKSEDGRKRRREDSRENRGAARRWDKRDGMEDREEGRHRRVGSEAEERRGDERKHRSRSDGRPHGRDYAGSHPNERHKREPGRECGRVHQERHRDRRRSQSEDREHDVHSEEDDRHQRVYKRERQGRRRRSKSGEREHITNGEASESVMRERGDRRHDKHRSRRRSESKDREGTRDREGDSDGGGGAHRKHHSHRRHESTEREHSHSHGRHHSSKKSHRH